jgi:two-component system, sensor histidine kinase PdtaS
MGLLMLLMSGAALGQQTRLDSLRQALTTATDTARIGVLHKLTAELAINSYADAVGYAQQGLAESKRLGWVRGEAQSLEDVGRLHWRQGNFTEAQQHLLAALTLWNKLRQPRRAARATHFIAELLTVTKQLEKALEWEEKGLASARAAQDTLTMVRVYIGFGRISSQQGRLAGALVFFQQALELTRAKYPEGAPHALVLNNIADAYLSLRQPRQALPHLFEASRLARKSNNKGSISNVEASLALAYNQLRKLDMGVYHGRMAQQFSTETGNIPLLITVNDLLDTLYSQQGNYRLAHHYSAQNRALEAKARQQEQESKVAELQGRYDTKEKERNIQLLTQQNQIAQLATLQQRTLRNAALVIALLLLLAISILFNRYRLRQRTVRLLNEQKKVLEAQDREKELLLREKTLLLKEVHHRVKNNLQLVLSLLNTQIYTLNEPSAVEAIRDSQSRVQTMALIHQNLYQSDSLARIDMHRYFTELTEAIVRAFRTQATAVALTLDIAPVQLNTHTAVPLGLIVNELVTNALKYAFPPGHPDKQVRVELAPQAGDTYRLVVADNGVGLPQGLQPANVASLGLRLVAGLARQMKAVLNTTPHHGTSGQGAQFTLIFQEVPITALTVHS